MGNQRTIRRQVSVEGIGLHSGEPVKLTLSPAAADTGILFRAADGTLVPADIDHVVDGRGATTLGAFGVRVRTIEHLMAAAAALGIDNLLADVSAEEVPALDGSSKPFVDLLYSAGAVTLPVPRRPLAVRDALRVGDQHRWLEITPSDVFRMTYTLENPHPVVGRQVASLEVSESTFVEELAPARTYGFLRDVAVMRKNGMARGGSLENAVVVGKRSVLNDSLRFDDEFVRHKMLDLVGDLWLLGRPLLGHVTAYNGGHALNHELVSAVRTAVAAERRPRAVRPQVKVVGRLADRLEQLVPGGLGSQPGIATL
ncbi:MAG TPA: UDP-3-O-acyl-N-acetylglucosamine deacetylase [Candidatus Bathyarchaeia archaeon]|nr:UDP-3-O-acyl-N-acetylglucosamine deacetylase [Candidatus Bathyarchaeia archaeon]